MSARAAITSRPAPPARRAFRLLAAAALAGALAGGEPAIAATGTVARDDPDLARVETYLDRIDTLQTRFMQVGPDGRTSSGTLYLDRPDKLRVDYDPPTPALLVAEQGWITYYDRELRQAEHLRVAETPAAVLLRPSMNFGADVRVTALDKAPGLVRITLESAKEPEAGAITLIFDDTPFELRQWIVRDPQGLETRVALDDLKKGLPLDPDLFIMREKAWDDR